jgi:hypothetical protein
VGLLAIGGESAEDVDPEVFPFLLAPGIVALEAGYLISEPIAE